MENNLHLQDDAVDGVVLIQSLQFVEKLAMRRGARKFDVLSRDSDFGGIL